MNPTEDALAKATAGLGDDLKPTGDAPAPTPPAAPDPTPPAADDPAKDKPPVDNKADNGFSADELDTDEPENKPEVKPEEINTDGLAPEQKYIVDNLPYITARVKSGNGTKDLQVKSWTQLPDDLEFASKRDELAFVNALQAQENRALALQAKFQQDTQATQNKEFEQKESAMIREDVAELQKEGELPKFKVKLDDPNFDKDPATQEVQKVIDFLEERNKQYFAEYQQGRPFRHIGFREAFYMYQRKNGVRPPAETKEDTERQQLAERLTGNRGLAAKEIKKSTVRSGTTINDILNRIDQEW